MLGLTTQAQAIDQAIAGQATDILSTAGALALGMSEVNPLFGPLVNDEPLVGLLVLGGGKYALIKYAESKPYYECIQGRTVSAKMGYAMGAHNVTVITGSILSWGSAVTPLGILAGFLAWNASDMDARMDAEERCFR